MTTTNNLDALFADTEPPFGHPGRRFDDTSNTLTLRLCWAIAAILSLCREL